MFSVSLSSRPTYCGLKNILESVHLKLDAIAEILMQFKMRNVYCLRFAVPFVVIYSLEDSLTHENVASYLDTCDAQAVNQTDDCGFYL
jgi:hypothetical protein